MNSAPTGRSPTRPATLELLAPAGHWECARAAVENGADAIYFGLDVGFNARARAANFSLVDLPSLMSYLHRRGVRGYVTLNTLVFSDELQPLLEHLTVLVAAGVDAVLVQDLGAARFIQAACPSLELHASTQMTLTSVAGLKTAEELGIRRVVLPRELSISEIASLSGQTSLGLEAFVHGALCVAYSGQCLTSESFGGRSANRGQCAQACRLPYELTCDDHLVELGDIKYLLSPQDLAAHALLPELIAAGVQAFKIEGRLKTPEYVANVTRHYRAALDEAARGHAYRLTDQAVEELELSFSRGFSTGWLQGCDHKLLVPGDRSSKRGIRVGSVVAMFHERVRVQLERSLRVGDGIVFEGDRSRHEEQGGRVFAIRQDGNITRDAVTGVVDLEFRRRDLHVPSLYPGQVIYKTDDPRLTKKLRATFGGADPRRKVPLDIFVRAIAGQPLEVKATAESGAGCSIGGSEPLPAARKHVATADLFREQLGRLGSTPYELRSVTAEIVGGPMAPLRLISEVRQAMIQALDASLEHVQRPSVRQDVLDTVPVSDEALPTSTSERPVLHVLCRHLGQLPAVLETGVRSLCVELADIRQYREAVIQAHAAAATIYLATPRIEKPGEQGIFAAMARHDADGWLVRNLGGLRFCQARQIPAVADFSLNAANEWSVGLLREWGAQRVTPSYDLNRDQLLDLLRHVPARVLEVVLHQHMPMFHMEHCVFCAVLSPGTNKTNCGRPCDDHQVRMRDRVGMEHPLHADVGCRNTLYNAVAQSGAEIAGTLLSAGVRHFRVELLDAAPNETRTIVSAYQQLLAGHLTGKQVWRRLQATNRIGVTRGTLEASRDPLAIV